MALAEMNFVDRCEVVHLLGPPGTGKSHLATALGVEAVKAGKSVYFLPLADLIGSLAKAEREGTLRERIRFYCRPALLIVDEIGYTLLHDPHRTARIPVAGFGRGHPRREAGRARRWQGPGRRERRDRLEDAGRSDLFIAAHCRSWKEAGAFYDRLRSIFLSSRHLPYYTHALRYNACNGRA